MTKREGPRGSSKRNNTVIDGRDLVTGNEQEEARQIVRELMGNTHDRDKLLMILNRHRERLGLRFGHVVMIALLYMSEGILEKTIRVVDIINTDHRANLRKLSEEAEFKSLTDPLAG